MTFLDAGLESGLIGREIVSIDAQVFLIDDAVFGRERSHIAHLCQFGIDWVFISPWKMVELVHIFHKIYPLFNAGLTFLFGLIEHRKLQKDHAKLIRKGNDL